MFIVPQGTTPDWKLEYVFDRAAGMRVAKRHRKRLFPQPLQMLHESFTHARSRSRTGEYIFQTSSPPIFPKNQKPCTPHGRPRWSTPWSRTRQLIFFEFFGKEREISFLLSKAWKSLYRRKFKELELRPRAAYKSAYSRLSSTTLFSCSLLLFLRVLVVGVMFFVFAIIVIITILITANHG